MKQFANSGVDSERRTIDVSGDGTNNGGRPVNEARDEAVAAGVTINGLAIINQHPNPGYFAHTQPPGGLGEYYKTNVTGGPGSFVITIEDFDSFAEAMTNKLVNEIASGGGAARACGALRQPPHARLSTLAARPHRQGSAHSSLLQILSARSRLIAARSFSPFSGVAALG
jgi:hypothetical protein